MSLFFLLIRKNGGRHDPSREHLNQSQSGKQMFIVAGPLAPQAMLTKGGKPAKLSEFKQGDQVRVGYKSTAQGPVIQSLKAK